MNEKCTLRLDRTQIPNLPRPVYEVVIEQQHDGVLVAVMTDASVTSPMELFDFPWKPGSLENLSSWLRNGRIFPKDDAAWRDVAAEIAKRVQQHFPAEK